MRYTTLRFSRRRYFLHFGALSEDFAPDYIRLLSTLIRYERDRQAIEVDLIAFEPYEYGLSCRRYTLIRQYGMDVIAGAA
jgi:hypothetical protein